MTHTRGGTKRPQNSTQTAFRCLLRRRVRSCAVFGLKCLLSSKGEGGTDSGDKESLISHECVIDGWGR